MKKKKLSKIKQAKIKLGWYEFLRHIFFVFFLVSLGTSLWFAIPFGMGRLDAKEDFLRDDFFKEIFPTYDNQPVRDAFWIGQTKIYPAFVFSEKGESEQAEYEESEETRSSTNLNELVGFAFEFTGEGYGGPIHLFVGVDMEGRVLGVQLWENQEQPVFMEFFQKRQDFFASLRGRDAHDLFLVQNGGKVHAVSSATITSRGVMEAVRGASQFYSDHKQEFLESVKDIIGSNEKPV